MRKTKTGRRASSDERERALELVRAYREENPATGELVPDDALPPRILDDEWLLACLVYFGNYGTFGGLFDDRSIKAQRVAAGAGPGYDDKIRAVVDSLHVSASTARRLLKPK